MGVKLEPFCFDRNVLRPRLLMRFVVPIFYFILYSHISK